MYQFYKQQKNKILAKIKKYNSIEIELKKKLKKETEIVETVKKLVESPSVLEILQNVLDATPGSKEYNNAKIRFNRMLSGKIP